MGFLGFQQHRPEASRVPAVEVTPAQRRLSKPRLELPGDPVNDLPGEQAVEDDIAVGTQKIESRGGFDDPCRRRDFFTVELRGAGSNMP